jgi:C4-type Zn-finger protein
VVKAPKMPCPVCGSPMNVFVNHIYSSNIYGEEVVAVCPYCEWGELLEIIYDYTE